MSKQSLFDEWFYSTIGTPKENMSLYMRRLLKTAYFDAYDAALTGPEMKELSEARYRAGYSAKRRKVSRGTK